MIPVAGSAYTYTYATLGRFLAWIIGWNLVLEYLAAASTVAVGWSGYFNNFLTRAGFPIPAAIASRAAGGPWLRRHDRHRHLVNLPAVALIGFITWVLIVGVKTSANFNNAMVIDQAHHRAGRDLRLLLATSCPPTIRPSFRPIPANSAISAGPACSAPPA